MNILKMMGLMRVSEHEACAEKIASLKRQLAVADTVNGRLRGDIEELSARIRQLKVWHRRDTEEIAALTPDALAWREKKRKDADYEANRRVRKAKGEKL